MNRSTTERRLLPAPALTAASLTGLLLVVTGGLPLASALADLLSQVLFRGSVHGPALSRLVLLLAGLALAGTALHRGLRALRVRTGTADR